MAFLLVIDHLASAGDPPGLVGAGIAVAAAMVQVIGLAGAVVIMHADFAACPGFASAVHGIIAFVITFGRKALAVPACTVDPAADDLLAYIAVAAAVIDIVVFADAFI